MCSNRTPRNQGTNLLVSSTVHVATAPLIWPMVDAHFSAHIPRERVWLARILVSRGLLLQLTGVEARRMG